MNPDDESVLHSFAATLNYNPPGFYILFLLRSLKATACTQFCGNSVLTFNCKYRYKAGVLLVFNHI